MAAKVRGLQGRQERVSLAPTHRQRPGDRDRRWGVQHQGQCARRDQGRPAGRAGRGRRRGL